MYINHWITLPGIKKVRFSNPPLVSAILSRPTIHLPYAVFSFLVVLSECFNNRFLTHQGKKTILSVVLPPASRFYSVNLSQILEIF